jgi:hypothetical protein
MQTKQQHASGSARTYAPPLVHDVLRQPGQPLERGARAAMESRFGRDFSAVRVHTGADAERATTAVGADAWTVGRHIAFRHPHIAPRLLAHELGHVVQQRNAEAAVGGALEIGETHDHFERDADAGATAVTVAPRLQRGFLDVVRDIALFIPRLFGAGGYSDEELRDYLKGLKERHAIENHIFSDNKARGCVEQNDETRLVALGAPYDLEVKRLLVEEMITGYTSFLDERAVIKLLSRQNDADLQAIVTQIGRDRILKKFSGGNYRIVRALMLTAADATDALLEELRKLDPDDVRDYERNARDQKVKEIAHKAWVFASTTAPVPSTAALTPADQSTFKIGTLDVIVDRDVEQSLKSSGGTGCHIERTALPVSYSDPATKKIARCDPPRLVGKVATTYDPGARPKGGSDYGRGTTTADIKAGQTSLRFHESQHGQDCFDYLGSHAVPVFNCPVGGGDAEFQKAYDDWEKAVAQYNHDAFEYSVHNTDCVGKPISDEQLRKFGIQNVKCPEK